MSDFLKIESIRMSLRMAELQMNKRDWDEFFNQIEKALDVAKTLGVSNVKSTANRKRKAKNTASSQ